MNQFVDALGKACPMPVIMAKKEIDAGNTSFVVAVDNQTAVENLKRLAESQGYQASVETKDGNFHVSFTGDGSEGVVFFADKIHARKGFRWVNPVHEVLRYDGGAYQTVTVPGIQLDHHADNTKSRAQYLPLLELAVQEDPQNDRNTHYLGREYLFRGEYQKAIDMLAAQMK